MTRTLSHRSGSSVKNLTKAHGEVLWALGMEMATEQVTIEEQQDGYKTMRTTRELEA